MARKISEVFVEVRANLSKLKAGMKQAISIASSGAGVVGKILGGLASLISGALSAAFAVVKTVVKSIISLFKSMFKWAKRGALALAAFVGISVAVGAKFGQSMARVKALTNASEKDFQSMRQEALRLGKATEFSASQAADAMGIFAMAGFKTKDIITAVTPTLDFAAAAGLGLAEAADIAARVMGGMQLKASELQHAMDVLTGAFTSANMSATDVGEAMKFVGAVGKTIGKDLEEVVGSITALAQAGLRGSMAGTGLRKVLMGLASSKTQKQLRQLGVEVIGANGTMRSMAEIIGDINRATIKMSETAIADLGLQMFGARGGVAFLALLGQGEQAIQGYTDHLRSVAGITERVASIQRDTLATSFKIVLSALEDLSIAVSDVFEPFVREGNKGLTKFFNTVASMVRDNTGVLQGWITSIRTWLTSDLPEYMIFAVGVAAQLFDRFKVVFTKIGEVIQQGTDKMSDFFEVGKLQGNPIQQVISGTAVALTKLTQILVRVGRAIKAIAQGTLELAKARYSRSAHIKAGIKFGIARENLTQERTRKEDEAVDDVIDFMNETWEAAGKEGGGDPGQRGREIVLPVFNAIAEPFKKAAALGEARKWMKDFGGLLSGPGKAIVAGGKAMLGMGGGGKGREGLQGFAAVLAAAQSASISTVIGQANVGVKEQTMLLRRIANSGDKTVTALEGLAE